MADGSVEYDEVLVLARGLAPEGRERLARELGAARPALTTLGTLAARPPAPQSVAWVKAERGHAVLATDTGPADAEIPAGWEAIAGMWADVRGEGP
jgi:hypothetical protein